MTSNAFRAQPVQPRLRARALAVAALFAFFAGCSHVEPMAFPAPALAPAPQPDRRPLEGMLAAEPKWDPLLVCAKDALESALRVIGEERWSDFQDDRASEPPPLQSFPRLVSPAVPRRCQGHWLVPVVFEADPETIRQDEAQASFENADPAVAFRFWMESAVLTEEAGTQLRTARFRRPNRVISSGELDDAGFATRLGEDRRAVVLALAEPRVAPGFWWIRIVPVPLRGMGQPKRADEKFAQDVLEGDLPRILRQLHQPAGENLGVEGTGSFFECKYRIGLDECAFPYRHFWTALSAVARVEDPSSTNGEWVAALRALYETDGSPAGVLLDDVGDEALSPLDGTFSFIVAADTQNSRDLSALTRFLEVAADGRTASSLRDESRSDRRVFRYERAVEDTVSKLHEELRLRSSRVHFVLLAGDVADSHASSDLVRMAFNVFGFWPPDNGYQEEFEAIAREIRRLGVPVIAIPGNHDGMVGYKGALNWLLLGGFERFDFMNRFVPVLFKPPLPWDVDPAYDGFDFFQSHLGLARHNAFTYRGHTFAGLNSFQLEQRERSGVGSVVFSWGGGVPRSEVAWLEDALDSEQRDGKHQFLFMHHDPRAVTPLKKTLELDRFGIYDPIDNVVSALTLGHFGLGHSPIWDVYWPLVTPLSHHSSRILDDVLSGRGRTQQEWMRRSFKWGTNGMELGEGAYNAQSLIESINQALSPDPRTGGGLSHIFFGHNDVPLGPADWVHTGDSGKVFVELPRARWHEGREFHLSLDRPALPVKWLLRGIFKLRNDEPPDWAKAMRVKNGNARVVRLDDVANPGGKHGFHLVTVDGGTNEVFVTWFSLPSDRTP